MVPYYGYAGLGSNQTILFAAEGGQISEFGAAGGSALWTLKTGYDTYDVAADQSAAYWTVTTINTSVSPTQITNNVNAAYLGQGAPTISW